jgi:hypothetical protein
VPTPEAVTEYKAAGNMSDYASRVKCVKVIDGIKYEVETTGAKVLANRYYGRIAIPESISFNGHTYPVTSIDGSAFRNCTSMQSIIIPGSVTSIGDYAFNGCSRMESVTFQSVTPPAFGTSVFNGSNECPIYVLTLDAVTAYCDATNMSSYASRIKCGAEIDGIKYEISGTAAKVLANNYSGDIVIPERILGSYPVTSIDGSAFKDCSGLTSVTVPNSVTSINEGMFSGCGALTKITLPFVGDRAHTSSDSFQYPIGYIFGTSAYTGGTNTVQYYYGKFTSSTTNTTYCIPTSLKEVVITGSSYISYGAFYNCKNLTAVTIPSSVTSISKSAFYNCPGLIKVTIGSNDVVSKYYSNVSENMKGIFGAQVTEYVLEEGITKIGYMAFNGCSKLKKVNIPESVTEIEDRAFYGCTELETVTIPEGISSIKYSVFYECSSLTSVNIPESVTSIGGSAFCGCYSLTSVTIPEGVTSIGSYAFSRCNGFTEVVFERATPPTFETNVFNNTNDCPIFVPTLAAVAEYKAAENMSSYASRVRWKKEIDGIMYGIGETDAIVLANNYSGDIAIPDSFLYNGNTYPVTSIFGSAFRNCSNLTSVIVPNSVTSIGAGAFSGCSGLTKITLPFVGDKPHLSYELYQYPFGYIFGTENFADATATNQLYYGSSTSSTTNTVYYIPTSLKEVVLTGGSNITYGAFYNCGNLTAVTIPSSVTSIPKDAFYNCKGIKKVTINSNAIVSPSQTYTASRNLSTIFGTQVTEYVLGEDVTTIGNYAFYKCSNLTSVTIPEGITAINYGAFKDCISLTSVTIPESVTLIGADVFSGCRGLAEVVFERTTPPTFGSDVFYNTNSCPIYVPTSAAATKYKAANNMSSYKNRIQSLTKAITVKVNNSFGTVSGGGDYMPNATATITATPADENCIFVGWDDNGEGNTNATRTITVSGDATYTAQFKRILTVSATASNRAYDGTTAVNGTLASADIADNDVVTFSYTSASFDNKNTGTNKVVTFSGISIGGANAGNYTLNDVTTATATADITPKTITVTATANSREYDGTVSASGSIALNGVVSSDKVSATYTATAFADKNAGTGKTVTFSGIAINGEDKGNYTLSSTTATATANITARTLTLSNFVTSGKTFDGTTNATGGAFSDDRVSGDALEFSFNYAFANMNAANAVAVNFSNIAISGGADKDNYSLLTTTGTCNAKISPVTDEVVLNFTMPTRTVMYNGQANRYEMPTADELFSTNNELYRMYGGFQPADNDAFQAARANVLAQTEVGEYTFGYNSGTLVNTSANFTNVKFNVTDGKLIITPNTNVVVTITENSSELTYNTEEQRVEGYTYSINDELNIYSEEDFSFSGNAVAAGTTVGTYPMELSAADFSNTNSNFADVTFNIVDGALTITKAPVAPNKPEAAIETRYINTQLVALPADWAWSEYAALAMGNNTATANYTGADKGNYQVESVDVTITRLECLHNDGNEVLYTLEPTCTHKGYTGNLSCKLCGVIYEMGDSIPALGHDFVETVIVPTCTAVGYTEHLCNRCQHIEYSDTVAANGHKAGSVVFENMVAATCTVAGSYDSVVYCSVCRVELSRDVVDVPAAGHKADSVVIENIVRPTLEAAGSYDSVIYCSVCKTEISRKKIDILASAVAVSKLPNKVEYKQGEKLDVAGGKLTVTYTDKSTEDFEMLSGWVSGSDSEKVGKQTLTVTFESVSSTLTTTFDVTVKEADNTAIDEDAAEISIYAYSNVIVVEAADAITGEIAVFDVNGRMVRKTLAAGTRTEIEMPRQGLYIVRVGNQAKRVVIK